MQRVRQQHTVERWEVDRAGEIARDRVDRRLVADAARGTNELSQRTRVAIDGVDRPRWPEELRERQREGTAPGAQVRPRGTRPVDRAPNERDRIALVQSAVMVNVAGGRPSYTAVSVYVPFVLLTV